MQVLKREIIFFLKVFKIEILKLEWKEPVEMEKTEDRKREDNWWRMRETGTKNRYYEAGEKYLQAHPVLQFHSMNAQVENNCSPPPKTGLYNRCLHQLTVGGSTTTISLITPSNKILVGKRPKEKLRE